MSAQLCFVVISIANGCYGDSTHFFPVHLPLTLNEGSLWCYWSVLHDDDLSLQLYHEVFELEFLRETETMYHEEALRVMRDSQFTVSAES